MATLKKPGPVQMPKKPVVVGDKLFTNTSKRWISTANLREDVVMVRRINHIDTEKRAAQQEYDYRMKSFRDKWDKKLDKNRLTKVPEARKTEEKKKEVAAYLRDVYSDTSSTAAFDMSAALQLFQSMNKGKKKVKKTKKIADIQEQIGESEGEEEIDTPQKRFSIASIPATNDNSGDVVEELHARLKSLQRPVKSAGDIKAPIYRPMLTRRSQSFSKLPDPGFRVYTPDDDGLMEEIRDANTISPGVVTHPKEEHVPQENQVKDRETEVDDSEEEEHESAVISEDGSLQLDKLCLTPRALPPLYQTKSKKPNVRPWDYPLAGSVRTPPDKVDKEAHKSDATFSDQSVDLKHCRYLRLAPTRKPTKKRHKSRKKEQFIMIVAGHPQQPDVLPVHNK